MSLPTDETTGSVVLITGAGSGLGRQLALLSHRQGRRLILLDRDAHGLEATGELLDGEPGSVLTLPADVTDPDACREAVGRGLAEFGRLDALLLCAGVSMWARFDQVEDLSIFRRLIEVNYLGAVHCIRPALSALRQARGIIVAISSLQAEIALPNHTGYSASKHALNGFLDGLEQEIGDEVRFLTVMPGWISGTNLRQNAFRAKGESAARRHSKESVTGEEAARLILRAIEQNRRTLYIPSKLRFLPWLRLIAPGLVRSLIHRAVRQQEKARP